MKRKNVKKSQTLWQQAKKNIHGGVPLLSKRPDMFLPDNWPVYFKKAKGVEITDLDGNKFIDMSYMGIGSCVLGYADPDVNRAVKKVIDSGSMSTLNSPEEVELAKILLKLHLWADQVRYARGGGDIAAMAIRIARAYAKNDIVAFCGYHGWHDWYLASNLGNKDSLLGHLLPGLHPLGVPKKLRGTAFPFEYNKLEQLEEIVKKHKIGVIIMEPMRHKEPKNDFLKKVRQIANKIGAVLIFDEISSGFRLRLGGIHQSFGITPDIVLYAKSISNGYPMGVMVGKRKIMKAADESFISSTYHSERIGPAATIATIKKMQKENVPHRLNQIGRLIEKGWKEKAEKYGLKIKIEGPYSLINFTFDYKEPVVLNTFFTQEMLKRGFLAKNIVYVSYAHKSSHLLKYFQAVDEVFALLSKAILEKKIEQLLEGPVISSGFRRLT